MQYEEKKQQNTEKKSHSVTIEERKNICITGVMDVKNCDEGCAVIITQMGQLTIKGKNLSMDKLDIDTGVMRLNGAFDTMEYKAAKKSGSKAISAWFQ